MQNTIEAEANQKIEQNRPSSIPTVFFRELCFDDAEAVADLETKMFSCNQRNGLEKIQELFLTNALYGSKLSIGLFHQSELLGYHLCYPKGFIGSVRSKYEKIILFSDLTIIKEYRSYTDEIIGKGLNACRIFFPDRPMHMFCFSYYKNKWEKREKIYNQNGYRLARCDRFYSTRFQEHLFRLRWEPIGMPLHSADRRYRFHFGAVMNLNLHRMKRLIRTRIK